MDNKEQFLIPQKIHNRPRRGCLSVNDFPKFKNRLNLEDSGNSLLSNSAASKKLPKQLDFDISTPLDCDAAI